MGTPSDRLPGKIKLLFEVAATPGAWERASKRGQKLAKERQADAFLDYRPGKRTWAVWSWAHHAGKSVISLSEVTDRHGRYGLTYLGPHKEPRGASYVRLRRQSRRSRSSRRSRRSRK